MPHAICKYNVKVDSNSETEQHCLEVLELANEYRDKLVASHHAEFKAVIDLRNDLFPDLIHSLEQYELRRARIAAIEKNIKAFHSAIRDRDAVPEEMAERLDEARDEAGTWKLRAKAAAKPWCRFERTCKEIFRSAADWKNIKVLSKRVEAYGSLDWGALKKRLKADLERRKRTSNPDDDDRAKAQRIYDAVEWDTKIRDIKRYYAIWMEHDLIRRRLSADFQKRGLHSSIRAEIVDASKPAKKRTDPGILYGYTPEPPKVDRWRKITLQIPGGLLAAEAMAGTKALTICPLPPRQRGKRTLYVYDVTQQIGTKDHPRLVTYRTKPQERSIDPHERIQRWTLVVGDDPPDPPRRMRPDDRNRRRPTYQMTPRRKMYCYPIVHSSLEKPMAETGTLKFMLHFRSVEGGVMVAAFQSDKVNERLVLPQWLVDMRMELKKIQQQCDKLANDRLLERGIFVNGKKYQGVEALKRYCQKHPDDVAAKTRWGILMEIIVRARKEQKQAVRIIEKIYETVTLRVCSQHAAIIESEFPLAKIARYDTRDLLKESPPRPVRELRQSVAPGKLKALLNGYGLASVDVVPDNAVIARETDLFTSYIKSLGRHIQSGEPRNRGRSQKKSGYGRESEVTSTP